MATTTTHLDNAEAERQTPAPGSLLVSLPSLAPETAVPLLQKLAEAFAGVPVTVAVPDAPAQPPAAALQNSGLKIITYTPAVLSNASWTLTAADFLNSHELVREHGATALLLLGPEPQSLEGSVLRAMADAALRERSDLVVPRYTLPPRAGLVNSAILYPISRALFGAAPRFPLAVDLCLSARMAERAATAAQRLTATNQPDALVWPIAEAATAGFSIAQVEAGPRILPQPDAPDFNSVLAHVTGSLFADVDAKAAFWQRARVARTARESSPSAPSTSAPEDEIQPMLDAFRLAYGNLLEIWSLVLPPQSLLGLKRLSAQPLQSFAMPDPLWARVVYDFLLAYRLRTLNRGHLLGAFTPLYLAWVASHLLQTGEGKDPERHIESVAAAFEADKPYLVARWRWPDRFNP